jgi:hypothetical protein
MEDPSRGARRVSTIMSTSRRCDDRLNPPSTPESQLAYGSLVFRAGGSIILSPGSIRARLQHSGVAPFSPSRFIDSSMVSVLPDVDREGSSIRHRLRHVRDVSLYTDASARLRDRRLLRSVGLESAGG